ncbi:MAG: hypothetical protein RI967_1431, partial [Planctomycetota bacterium]
MQEPRDSPTTPKPVRPRELERAAAAIAAPRGGAGRSPSASSSASSHDASPVRPPRFGAWTLDARCRVHRFAPFAHGDAPDHLHPATRAVAAVAARGAIDHDRPRARAMAVPVAAIVAALAAGSLAAMLFSSGALSTGNRELLTLAGLLAAVPVARLLRAHVAFRHRGFAVAVPLLVLGRCGACGHPLHGSPALAPVPADGDEGPRCACAECGAIWPHQAAGAPRDDDGRTRTDFPTVTGVDAWRLRRILSRAMRADASDFRRDERSRPFHIASFGVDSHGAAAAAWSESARALRFVAVAFVALFLAGCPIAVIASLVSGIALGPAGVASPSDAFLAVAPVVLCG